MDHISSAISELIRIFRKQDHSRSTTAQEEALRVFKEVDMIVYDARLVIPHSKATLNSVLVDIQPSERKPDEFIRNHLKYYRKVGQNLGRTCDLICLLAQNSLTLADFTGKTYGTQFKKKQGKIVLKEPFTWNMTETDRFSKIITSLITVIEKKRVYDAESFAVRFGSWSILGVWAQNQLLQYFEENFEEIKDLYNEWENHFGEVYQKNDITIELFIKHTYLAYLVKTILIEQFTDKHHSATLFFSSLSNHLNDRKNSLLKCDFFYWADNVPGLYDRLYYAIHEAKFASTDLFRVIYQELVSPSTRHALGEFYTPPEMARLMINEIYTLGQKVLDPSCGSGTFLVEIIKKIRNSGLGIDGQVQAIEKLYGFDVNPIAVIVCKANILLQVGALTEKPLSLNIYLCNSLFPPKYRQTSRLDLGKCYNFPISKEIIQTLGEVDLVIGNPPWLVLNRVHSIYYKEELKKLARDFKIDPEAHQVANLEMSALFLYAAKDYYLKDGGKVFFIVSNAFMSGNNHAGTRQFHDFKEIVFWKFDRDIFNIHNICIMVTVENGIKRNKKALENLEVDVALFSVTNSTKKSTTLTKINEERYVPYTVKEHPSKAKNHNRYSVGKLIPKSARLNLLKFGFNPYAKSCYKGGDLFPRNLIFIEILRKKGINQRKYCEIRHIVSKNAKPPWSFDPLKELVNQNKYSQESVLVEERFIYQAVKSTEIVPFLFLETKPIFLPIEMDTINGGYKLTESKNSLGWKHFRHLSELYTANYKEGASITDLWTNVNWQGKLTSARQRKPVRVVIQASGTLVKAAIVPFTGKVIIDCTNTFIGLEDLSEAYYLSGFLNSPLLTKSIRIIQAEGAGGGGRHILKRPFEFFLPKFDKNDTAHVKLSTKAQRMEREAQKILQRWINEEKKKKQTDSIKLRPLTIQNRIYKALGWNIRTGEVSGLYHDLNELVNQIIYEIR
ncbi:MAG: class I SAM-dependent DNA methyltransferase [Candidatus Hodarchaeota archaeon]